MFSKEQWQNKAQRDLALAVLTRTLNLQLTELDKAMIDEYPMEEVRGILVRSGMPATVAKFMVAYTALGIMLTTCAEQDDAEVKQ